VIFCGCEKEKSLPLLETMAVSNIALTTAESGGIITGDGGSEIIASGVCWSTNENPTIQDSKTIDDINNGSFSSKMTGLIPYTRYYVRAYATNSEGTGYGKSIPIAKSDSIYAGIYNTSFIYHEFPNPITLNLEMESNMLVANAMDTITMYFDNDSMSLFVYLKTVNPDSQMVISQLDTFINCRLDIASADSVSFHITERQYGVGLGQIATFHFVTAFFNNQIIRNNSKWSANGAIGLLHWNSMWSYPTKFPVSILGYDGGEWYIPGPNRYIGFKYKGRLGWIKVDISHSKSPKFIGYALKK
jgi:hypothetical protein